MTIDLEKKSGANEPPYTHRVDVPDRQDAILDFARQAALRGKAALAILCEIRGGAARSLGALVAVDETGGYCGYVSGGCVEAAVAAEALLAMEAGHDRLIRYGEGSEFFDIVLPCGGGIMVAIHVLRDSVPIELALETLESRKPVSLVYHAEKQALSCMQAVHEAGWSGQDFAIALRPKLRLLISGSGNEAAALHRLAGAAGYQTEGLEEAGTPDPQSAIIFLNHDIERDLAAMVCAIQGPALYIGALGSRRTHEKRIARLKEEGMDDGAIARIRAPIGLFGPVRYSGALAVSILAEIVALEGQEKS